MSHDRSGIRSSELATILVAVCSALQILGMDFRAPGVSPDVALRQAERYRRMTPTQKLALADDLWRLSWDAVRAGIRLRHPTFDEATVEAHARVAFRRAAD